MLGFIDPQDPTVWVAVCLIIFFVMLYYMKVHAKIAKALDNRADAIRSELEEAQKMREEAQALLAEYQRKQHEAEETAENIVAQAKKEAAAFAQETRDSLQASLERRTKMAEDKIARAETEASAEVRAAAVDLAIQAAEKILSDKLTAQAAGELIDQSIKDVKAKLH